MAELHITYDELKALENQFRMLAQQKYEVEELGFPGPGVSADPATRRKIPATLKIKLKGDDHYYSGEVWLNDFILRKGRIFCHLVPSSWGTSRNQSTEEATRIYNERNAKRFELEKELTAMLDSLIE